MDLNTSREWNKRIEELPHYLQFLKDDEGLQICQERAMFLQRKYDHVVFIGVGGSALAPKAISSMIGQDYFSVVDSLEPERLLNLVQRKDRVHYVCISKSGNTIETLALLNFVLQKTGEYMDPDDFTVISSNLDSELGRWAKAHHVIVLELPQGVGGRFSVFSPVGFLPLALCGYDLFSMRDRILTEFIQNPSFPSFYDFLQKICREHTPVLVVWSYGDTLIDAALWFQQLWSESLGKKDIGNGWAVPTPLICRGPSDQHSLLQQFSEQPEGKAHLFFNRKRDPIIHFDDPFFRDHRLEGWSLSGLMDVEAAACKKALEHAGASTSALEFRTMNDLMKFFVFSCLAVDLMAQELKINAFDQPGVELCKKLIHSLLTRQSLGANDQLREHRA